MSHTSHQPDPGAERPLDPELEARIDVVTEGCVSDRCDVVPDDAFDYAAAVLLRSETQPLAVPAGLKARWQRDADDYAARRRHPGVGAAGFGGARFGPLPVFLAGALSAAAVLLLGLGLWQLFGAPSAPSDGVLVERRPTAPLADDWVTATWSGGAPGYESVRGEVRWSPSLQGGQMRFTGLAANDPTQGQYQLWIVDPTRDAEPVDGGVFDIVDAGRSTEAVVAFSAKLRVDQPTVFAVTYEKPGGVVVSEGPLLITASPKKG